MCEKGLIYSKNSIHILNIEELIFGKVHGFKTNFQNNNDSVSFVLFPTVLTLICSIYFII